MTPYYQDEAVCIYHSDCRDVVPSLLKTDLLLTDPPYGHGERWSGGTWASDPMYDDAQAWDAETFPEADLLALLAIATHAIVWGGNYYQLPLSRCWLAWVKSSLMTTMADFELAWTTFDKPSKMIRENRNADGKRWHPTQKPESVMRWAMLQAPDGCAVIDPFMGSGTTACCRQAARPKSDWYRARTEVLRDGGGTTGPGCSRFGDGRMNDLQLVSHPDAVTVARMIGALAEMFGEPLSETRLEAYLAALADVPTEALRLGLQHAMRTCRFFPRPAELRSAVDTAIASRPLLQRLAGQVTDDLDPRVSVHCQKCDDSGWVVVGERPNGKANSVRRCFCVATNPKLVEQRKYGESSGHGGGAR